MPVLSRGDLEVSSALRVSVMRLARRLRNERASDLLSLSQVSVLATLDRHGPLTPGELAGHERVSAPSMTRTLGGLQQMGLVGRTAHPSDGRQQLVAITATAHEVLRADRRRRDAWLARRLGELTPDERDVLRAAAPVIEKLATT